MDISRHAPLRASRSPAQQQQQQQHQQQRHRPILCPRRASDRDADGGDGHVSQQQQQQQQQQHRSRGSSVDTTLSHTSEAYARTPTPSPSNAHTAAALYMSGFANPRGNGAAASDVVLYRRGPGFSAQPIRTNTQQRQQAPPPQQQQQQQQQQAPPPMQFTGIEELDSAQCPGCLYAHSELMQAVRRGVWQRLNLGMSCKTDATNICKFYYNTIYKDVHAHWTRAVADLDAARSAAATAASAASAEAAVDDDDAAAAAAVAVANADAYADIDGGGGGGGGGDDDDDDDGGDDEIRRLEREVEQRRPVEWSVNGVVWHFAVHDTSTHGNVFCAHVSLEASKAVYLRETFKLDLASASSDNVMSEMFVRTVTTLKKHIEDVAAITARTSSAASAANGTAAAAAAAAARARRTSLR